MGPMRQVLRYSGYLKMKAAEADDVHVALVRATQDGPALSLPATLVGSAQAPNAVVETSSATTSTSIDWNEERIDPDQRKVWNFNEYHAAHIDVYSLQDIHDYSAIHF